ncbi:MAG: EAL domain-containing protein [Idiomarina sp.]|nr:EAL domain-containing protein [Idiomarina sp.]
MEVSPNLSTLCSAFDISQAPSILLDAQLRIHWCNHAYVDLLGLTKAQLLNHYLFDALPEESEHNKHQLIQSFDHVIRNKQSHRIAKLRYDLEPTVGEAPESSNVRYWAVINSPLLNSAGEVAYILNQPTDITELVKLDAESGLQVFARQSSEFTMAADRGFLALLYQERSRLNELFQQAPGFIAVLMGADYTFEMANNAYRELIGGRPLIGKKLVDALPEVIPQGFLTYLDNVRATGEPFIGKATPVNVRRGKNFEIQQRYIDYIYQPFKDVNGVVSGIFVQGHDVTEAHELHQLVTYQATHDPLTNLHNRRAVQDYVKPLQHTNGPHVVLYLDLDHFKIINDRCGHHAGDEMLVKVAEALNKEAHRGFLARIGGDEFLMVLEGHSIAQAYATASCLIEHIEHIVFFWQGKRYWISVSIGVAAFGHTTNVSFSEAMSMADSACFLAKDKGRNRIQVSVLDDGDTRQQLNDMDWATRLKSAMLDDHIVLFEQRIMNLRDNHAPPHKEVLARLIEPSGEIVMPGSFIKAAERFGLIGQLDRHIIRKTFAYLAAHRAPVKLFVNVSGVTLSDERSEDGFATFVECLLKEYPQVSASSICFEITETAAVTHIERTARMMQTLKDLGFEFALDDFGSGMATFSYLSQLPVSYVKIDGSFVSKIQQNAIAEVIVNAVRDVAQVMGIQTIAECVEEQTLIPRLQSLHIDFAQGYAVQRPQRLV